MKTIVRLSTLIAAISVALGSAAPALAEPVWPAAPPPYAVDVPSPHPAIAVGVADLVAMGGLVPIGVGVGFEVNDNGWEKAASIMGAGLGVGVHGVAALLHGADDAKRTLKDPVAAGFGWMFTSLSASGVGAGLGLVIGGERDGKPIGGVIAATSLIFLAPGIPLIADGERSAPVYQTPHQFPGDPPPPRPEDAPTRMNSPAMVGFGAASVTLGGISSMVGIAGLSADSSGYGSALNALGAVTLASGLGLAVFVGTPLLVVGSRRVPDVPTVYVGPGGVNVGGSF